MSDIAVIPKIDGRPKRGEWSPGLIFCWCQVCKLTFFGAHGAMQCADCAYAEPVPDLKPDGRPPYLQALFNHMSEAHGLTLLESEMHDIVRAVDASRAAAGETWVKLEAKP